MVSVQPTLQGEQVEDLLRTSRRDVPTRFAMTTNYVSRSKTCPTSENPTAHHALLAGAGAIRRNSHHAPNDCRAHCKDRSAPERRERMSSEVREIPGEIVVVMARMCESDNRKRYNEEGGEKCGAVGISHDFGGN